jgi:hypothetical protein
MATTWTETTIYYNVQVESGPYSLQIIINVGDQSEADIDTAMESFLDAYNSLHTLESVGKTYDGTGVSDWSYTP